MSNKSAEPLIEINNFRMDFGKTTVIKDLSFTINRGETFGLLGSNGSGKTTTIRALLGIFPATGGTLTMNGKPYSVDSGVKLGYLPEERGLYKKEKVLDVMIYFGKLKGYSAQQAAKESIAYLERVGLTNKSDTRLDKLSGGQQQKVQLGVAIMANPELLILDEPTKGFDPVNRRLLMDIIEEHQQKGATVIFVTHQMEEVERLCDRVILLKDGAAQVYGTIDEIKEQAGGMTIEIVSKEAVPRNPKLYTVVRSEGNSTFLDPLTEPLEIQKSLADNGFSYTKFEMKRPSLDDIFVSIYGAKTEKAGK